MGLVVGSHPQAIDSARPHDTPAVFIQDGGGSWYLVVYVLLTID